MRKEITQFTCDYCKHQSIAEPLFWGRAYTYGGFTYVRWNSTDDVDGEDTYHFCSSSCVHDHFEANFLVRAAIAK